MKLGVLFSGGKDSCMACWKAMQKHDIVCLISLFSRNKESFMFHTPNNSLLKLQAEAIELPLLVHETAGEKEKELVDLKEAISAAKKKYHIHGIVTGALASVYQASRIQKICDELELQCVNPLWQMDQVELLNEVVDSGFEVIISGVFAEPFGKEWLGRKLTHDAVKELALMQQKYKINPAGEGGEIETTVLDAPFFKKRVVVQDANLSYGHYAGVYTIEKAELVYK